MLISNTGGGNLRELMYCEVNCSAMKVTKTIKKIALGRYLFACIFYSVYDHQRTVARFINPNNIPESRHTSTLIYKEPDCGYTCRSETNSNLKRQVKVHIKIKRIILQY